MKEAVVYGEGDVTVASEELAHGAHGGFIEGGPTATVYEDDGRLRSGGGSGGAVDVEVQIDTLNSGEANVLLSGNGIGRGLNLKSEGDEEDCDLVHQHQDTTNFRDG